MNADIPSAESLAAHQAREFLDQGLAASQVGDAARAGEWFGRAAQLAPHWPLPPFLQGSEHAAAGDFDRAEACFAQAVLLDPQFHLARYQLGLLQLSGGRPQLAMLSWEPLHALPGSDPLGHFVRGFAALAIDQAAEARAHFEAGIPLAADNPALQSDVRKVLAAMDEQLSPSATQATPEERPANHILLSNYSAGGTVH